MAHPSSNSDEMEVGGKQVDKPNSGSYQDGLEDGQQVGLFMAYRIIKAEKKLHAYNSGAGRVLKTLEEKLMKQVEAL